MASSRSKIASNITHPSLNNPRHTKTLHWKAIPGIWIATQSLDTMTGWKGGGASPAVHFQKMLSSWNIENVYRYFASFVENEKLILHSSFISSRFCCGCRRWERSRRVLMGGKALQKVREPCQVMSYVLATVWKWDKLIQCERWATTSICSLCSILKHRFTGGGCCLAILDFKCVI